MIGEASVVGLVGLFLGLLTGWLAINVLQKLESIRGYFEPNYDAEVFTRAGLRLRRRADRRGVPGHACRVPLAGGGAPQ